MLKRLSLRARLTLLSALVTAGVAVSLTAMSLFGADRIFLRGVREDLTLQAMTIVPATPADPASEVLRSAEIERTQDQEESLRRADEPAAAFVTDDPQGETVQAIQIALSHAGRQFHLWGLLGLLSATLLGAGATWLMAGRALRPVQELSAAIGETGGSDFSRRVDVGGRQDEIGRLAQSFNAMMDKVEASFERQKRFSANAAHELKTPLATIQVGLDVLDLDDHPSPARMEKALSVARTNTSRMILLVDDLFRLSSEEDFDLCDEVSIPELFSEVLAELAPQIKAKRLITSVKAGPACKLTGCRTMLYRALFNLAENAVKYNREGGTVSLCAAQDADAVVIQVSDTGIGIPGCALNDIFEPFYRVDRSRSRAVGGCGLGLSLVQDIVRKHGGTVTAQSSPGEGTAFLLRFGHLEKENKPPNHLDG